VINIYTLRTIIEILFRELKQSLNIENFHSHTLNGVLSELFAAMRGMRLIEWLRQCHPMQGGFSDAITAVRDGWNETLRSVGSSVCLCLCPVRRRHERRLSAAVEE
jgi:hypothetical protein